MRAVLSTASNTNVAEAVQASAPSEASQGASTRPTGSANSRSASQPVPTAVSSSSAPSALPLQAAATDDEEDDPPETADGVVKPIAATPDLGQAALSQTQTANAPTAAAPTQQTQDPTSGSIDRTQLINQVADRIQLLAATRQQDGVVVHLQPPNLGSITLVVKTVASNVSAQVTATDDHVRSALELGRDQLGQQLQSRGYHLTSISVGSTSSSAGAGSNLSQNSRNGANGPGSWQGQQQSSQQNAGRPAAQRPTTSIKSETAGPSRPTSVSSSSQPGLDLWI